MNTVPVESIGENSFDTIFLRCPEEARESTLERLLLHRAFPVAAAERIARQYKIWAPYIKSQEKNTNLPVSVLHEALRENPHDHITHCAVARHPNTPLDTLIQLSASRVHARVRRTAAKNPLLPQHILEDLAKNDTSKEVREAAAAKLKKRARLAALPPQRKAGTYEV